MTTTGRGLGWPEPGLVVGRVSGDDGGDGTGDAGVGWPRPEMVSATALEAPGRLSEAELAPGAAALSIVSPAAGRVRAPVMAQSRDQESWDWIEQWDHGQVWME